MFMRRRRPLMRAAMVGGTAYYAGKRVQEGREEDYDRDARIAELEQQQMAQQQAPPPRQESGGDMLEQLERLGKLKEQGVLNEAEFEEQKRKLLMSS